MAGAAVKIAVIGTGIAGNVVARELNDEHEITVYESAGHIGGHVHTHAIEWGGRSYQVDTGFIVYNDRNYPYFSSLLKELGVESQDSRMSFSVRDESSGLEYNGDTLNTLFAQRLNLMRPSFLGMIGDILRFNSDAQVLLSSTCDEQPLADFLARNRYGRAFIKQYIIPLGAAIWSTDPRSMLQFPARFFLRFLQNHGLLSINDRPQWRTVRGGSARYVEKLTASFRERIRLNTRVEFVRRVPGGVLVKAARLEAAHYDAAFLACHSDQALELLADPLPVEREVLGAIRYQENEAVLHTDARLMPKRRLAWAAWNYHLPANDNSRVALTYNMNALQNLNSPTPLLVTINPGGNIAPEHVLRRMTYHHPVFTPAAVAAQARHRDLNGPVTYYSGAWLGYGFHEDGAASANAALRHFREDHEQRAVYRSA